MFHVGHRLSYCFPGCQVDVFSAPADFRKTSSLKRGLVAWSAGRKSLTRSTRRLLFVFRIWRARSSKWVRVRTARGSFVPDVRPTIGPVWGLLRRTCFVALGVNRYFASLFLVSFVRYVQFLASNPTACLAGAFNQPNFPSNSSRQNSITSSRV